MIKTFELNEKGRDFVVGDIHGCFNKLQASLDKIGFNTETDRLFAVGDLVDRGPESDEVCDWLSRPWFHSVRGNHDQFIVEYMEGPMDVGIYMLNGGKWFLSDIPAESRPYYYNEIKKLPIIIEVITPNGVVGIVHADVAGNDWGAFKANIKNYDIYAMWGRERIKGKHGDEVIQGVYRVYAGHTPVPEVYDVGNVRYIDMGVCFGRNDFHLEQIN
jgi:serine/threonine protein phosphatase 1